MTGPGTVAAGALSCQSLGAGLTDCGSSKESCCTSLGIPGGQFFRSYGMASQGQLMGGTRGDPATVSSLRIDKYLVTVGRFRRFVAAALGGSEGGTGWTPTQGSGKHTHLNGGRGLQDSGSPGVFETGWDPSDDIYLDPNTLLGNIGCDPYYATWTDSAGANENLPINCVSWFQAYAFCIWDGGFLSSEAEFEFAAAGGQQALAYPWGSLDPTSTPCTSPASSPCYVIWNCQYQSDAGVCSGANNIAPVGTAADGKGFYGHLDLSGELNEWLLDYNASYVTPCTDCAFVTHASGREVRGGWYQSSSTIEIQSAYRNEGLYPTNYYKSNGFRCARPPS